MATSTLTTSAPLGLTIVEGKNKHWISKVVEGGQAAKAGLTQGTELLEVNGESVVAMSHEDVIKKMTSKDSDSLVLKYSNPYFPRRNTKNAVGPFLPSFMLALVWLFAGIMYKNRSRALNTCPKTAEVYKIIEPILIVGFVAAHCLVLFGFLRKKGSVAVILPPKESKKEQ